MKKLFYILLTGVVALTSLGLQADQAGAMPLPKDLGGLVNKLVKPEVRRCPLNTDQAQALPFWCSCKWRSGATVNGFRWPCRCPLATTNANVGYCGCRRMIDSNIQNLSIMCPLKLDPQTDTNPTADPTKLEAQSAKPKAPISMPAPEDTMPIDTEIRQPNVYPSTNSPKQRQPLPPIYKQTPGIVPPLTTSY